MPADVALSTHPVERDNHVAFPLINPSRTLKLTKRLSSVGYFYVLIYTKWFS